MAVSLGLLVCTLTCKKEMFIKKIKKGRKGQGGREEGKSREDERGKANCVYVNSSITVN